MKKTIQLGVMVVTIGLMIAACKGKNSNSNADTSVRTESGGATSGDSTGKGNSMVDTGSSTSPAAKDTARKM